MEKKNTKINIEDKNSNSSQTKKNKKEVSSKVKESETKIPSTSKSTKTATSTKSKIVKEKAATKKIEKQPSSSNKAKNEKKLDTSEKKNLSNKNINKDNPKIDKNDKRKTDELIAFVENVSEEAELAKEINKNSLINQNAINKNELDTIKNEIKQNKKEKKSSKKTQLKYKKILKNTLIAISILIYFIVLIIGKDLISTIKFITDLKVLILIEVLSSIIIFEISYKQDNFSFAMHGLEILAMAISTVITLDFVNKQNENINYVFAIFVVVFTIYYLIKNLVLALKKEKK